MVVLGVFAGLIITSMVAVAAVTVTMTFSDVPSDHWAYEAVSFNARAGIMTGPGDRPGMFDPAGGVNRAQLAAVAQRVYIGASTDAIKAMLSPMLEATLDGEQAKVTTDADGWANLVLIDNVLFYNISVSGLSGPMTAAHIHAGAAGVSGSPVHTLTFTDNAAFGAWTDLTEAQAEDLMDGKFYVNVHTDEHPDGEIRGQIMME